jgi:subtilisin family serine protease
MAVSATVNGVAYSQAMDFGGGKPDLRLTVNPGDVITYIVEWDDPWSDTATANDPNDFDVVVFDAPNGSGTAVACNQGINIGPAGNGTQCNEAKSSSLKTPGPQPVQGNQWTAHQDTYYLEVFGVHGSLANKRIKVLVYDQAGFQLVLTPRTAGSVFSHAALAEPAVISVGAINAGDLTLESYSSTGPVETGTGGTHTSVAKPDFVAPDCVDVTGAGGFETPFCGTSAAAPHIAGLMALLISGYPDTSPYKLLQQSATPRGKPVPNNEFGYGLPNMKTLLNKGVRPSPKKSGGGGDVNLLSLLALGLGLLRRRYPSK